MSLDDHSNHSIHNDTYWWITECTLHLNTDGRRIALFLLYLFVFTVGLLENTVVVWVNWRRRHSANGVLFCIINMSLSDLMVIVVLPFLMMEVTMDHVWLWGHFLCHVTTFIYVANFYSSSFFLAFMTLERYLSLTRPSSATCFPVVGRRRWLLCGGLWLLSFLLALLKNIHVQLTKWDEPSCYMTPDHNEIELYIVNELFATVFQFLGPAAIIITFNILIARTVRTAPDVQGRREVWLVHVYSLVFVVCWLPYQLVKTVLLIDFLHEDPGLDNPYVLLSCNTFEVLYFSYTVMQGLTLFHCIANPILYNFLSKSFRNNLINTVMNYLPREVQVGPGFQPNAADTGRKEAGKQQRISDVSTSHSDVES